MSTTIATEAGRACLDWGFGTLDVPYITAMIVRTNAPSIRVAERLDMRPRRHDVLLDLPVVVYAMDRERAETSAAGTHTRS